jgi:Ca2+-transporting ATPase
MMVGTLAVLYYGIRTGSEARALTLAFTTFVLFQFFNVFNARSEFGTAFNARFFDNRMLWMSLVGTLALQAVAVHWMPASQLFGTTGMGWADWAIAIGVASTVLLLEETRKLVAPAFQSLHR